jgi:hypothetical protein
MNRHRTPSQLSLFERPTLNIAKPVKEAMSSDVLKSGLSREQVVDRMNELAASYGVDLSNGNSRKLTLEIFEKWISPNNTARQMPLKAVSIFCAAVGGCAVLDVIARPIGSRVIGDQEQKLLSWAKAKRAISEHNRTVRRLEAEL